MNENDYDYIITFTCFLPSMHIHQQRKAKLSPSTNATEMAFIGGPFRITLTAKLDMSYLKQVCVTKMTKHVAKGTTSVKVKFKCKI